MTGFKQFIMELFKDKTNSYSLREVVIAILLAAMLISWVGAQFFNHAVPEAIFYSFASLIAAGCFGYSFEKKSSLPE